jgi:hypothetical protein
VTYISNAIKTHGARRILRRQRSSSRLAFLDISKYTAAGKTRGGYTKKGRRIRSTEPINARP